MEFRSALDELHEQFYEKQHVIWDWNGTLQNDVNHAVNTMNRLLAAHDLEPINKDHYRQIFEFPVLNYYKTLGFDFEKESFESLCHKFVDQFMIGFKNCPLMPGMSKIMDRNKELNLKQSILSATDQESLDEMVNHFNLRTNFDFVYGINNKFASSKLSRGRELIEVSGISKTNTVLVGDTLHDLEVGQALGIEVVLLSHGHQCAKKLRSNHDRVIEFSIGGVH